MGTNPPARFFCCMRKPTSDTDRSFKRCSACEVHWPSRAAFLKDPAVRWLGYQPGWNPAAGGLMLFNHELCGSTVAVPIQAFADLSAVAPLAAPHLVPENRKRFCLAHQNGEACPPECGCAFVARISEIIERLSNRSRTPVGPRAGL